MGKSAESQGGSCLPLHDAVRQGNLAEVRRLLANGADPYTEWEDPYGQRFDALALATLSGRHSIVAALVAAGTDVIRAEALTYAIWSGDLHLARVCLDSGARPDDGIHAAATSSAAMLGLLLEAGADPNTVARDLDGITPLFFAAGRDGSREAVEILVAAGADVHQCNDDGETALMWAAYQRDWCDPRNPLCALLAAGADPDAFNAEHEEKGVIASPLLGAAQHRRFANCHYLLKGSALAAEREWKPANPNVADRGGWTPLLYAVANGDDVLVSLLLEYGADPSQRSNRGDTVHALAEAHHQRVINAIRGAP